MRQKQESPRRTVSASRELYSSLVYLRISVLVSDRDPAKGHTRKQRQPQQQEQQPASPKAHPDRVNEYGSSRTSPHRR